MPDGDARPAWIDPETWEWLGELAAARFDGDKQEAAAAVLRAARLTEWQPNRVDPPRDQWAPDQGRTDTTTNP